MVKIEKCKYQIVVDTRERIVNHVLDKFDEGFELKPSHHDMCKGKQSKYSEPIKYYKQDKGLKTGDFTICVELPNKKQINFQDKIVIERKKDLNEICSNFFDDKDENGMTRLERELRRGFEQNIKIHLLVEQADLHGKILSSKNFRYDKASKVTPHSFYAMLHSLLDRYNVTLWYCDKRESARLIHDILYYSSREYLKNIEL